MVRWSGNASSRLPGGCELSAGADGALLRVPIARRGTVQAYLCLWYSRHDPLVVDLAICSSWGKPVLERALSRSDLQASLRRDIWTRGLRVRRGRVQEMLTVEVSERRARAESTVPRSAVRAFLNACDRLVPADAEHDAICDSIDRMLAMTLRTNEHGPIGRESDGLV